ncbi:hypothetical protein Kpol_1052p32, partial [Vanderwaltozyma polyspora DSM 70294]
MQYSSDKQDSNFQWKPTGSFIYGVLIKPYLPLKRHPELIYHSSYYANLYPGDEIYIFEETTDGKWCRGYQCWNPLPEEYISLSASLGDKLPDVKSKEVIFPKKFAKTFPDRKVTTIDTLKVPGKEYFDERCKKVSCKSPSLLEIASSSNDRTYCDISVFSFSLRKTSKPPFPYFRYQERPFVDELGPLLSTLSSHIYTMFSANEYMIYYKLIQLYQELDRIRLRLRFHLTTEREKIRITRSAASFLPKLSKFISSRDKSTKSDGSPSKSKSVYTDPSGYEGIFSRDIDTGELCSIKDSKLKMFVTNSLLSSFMNDFPAMNSELLDNEPKDSQKIFEYSPSNILVDFKDVTSHPDIVDPKFNNLSALMYLRTRDEVLTEPFTVSIDLENIVSVQNISAALFGNIPQSKIENNNVFLVVVLIEDVPVEIPFKQQAEFSTSIENNYNEPAVLNSVRRGVATGVTDISRVFSDNAGGLATGMPYAFNVR